MRPTLGVRFFSILSEKTSTAWVGAHSTPAVSLPCLGSLVLDLGAAASGFAFTLCDYAATVGVVLSNDPDAHIDCIGETDRARKLQDRVGSLERRRCVSISCALFASFIGWLKHTKLRSLTLLV